MIKTKQTQRARRWLVNHCENSIRTIIEDDIPISEVFVPKVIEKSDAILKIKSKGIDREIPLKLNVYKMKDSDTKIIECISGYKYMNNNIIVYTALKFDNETNQKVVCSKWGYVADRKTIENQELVNN